jgi:putative flippase GtrA
LNKRFAAFVLIGGLAAALNVGARILVDIYVSYDVAIVIAFFIALTFAFTLNRTYVFTQGAGGIPKQYWRFMLINLLALAQVWAISVGLARWLFPAAGFDWHAETVAHAIGVVSPVATSFFLHKHFSFAERRA